MEIDELIEAYLASHQKHFARLSKNGVARIAYLAGYLAAQQSVQSDVCPSCAGEKQVIGEDSTVWVCGICGGTGKRR